MSVLDSFSLKDRVIVITGASSGIGRAIAIACAEAGATVAAVGRNRERLEALLGELQKINSNPHVTKEFDVTDFDRIPEAVSEIVNHCGKISGFVHSAGVCRTVPLKVLSVELYEESFRTNVFACFEFVKAIISKKNMVKDRQASFVAISSAAATKGAGGMSCYASTKGAINSGFRALGAELVHKGIRMNTVMPGHVLDTQIGQETLQQTGIIADIALTHPLGAGCTADIVGPVIFLLSDASRWVTGALIPVDGGYTL